MGPRFSKRRACHDGAELVGDARRVHHYVWAKGSVAKIQGQFSGDHVLAFTFRLHRMITLLLFHFHFDRFLEIFVKRNDNAARRRVWQN